jgi:hypothetical protein
LLSFICEDERRHGVGKAVISSPTKKAQTEASQCSPGIFSSE